MTGPYQNSGDCFNLRWLLFSLLVGWLAGWLTSSLALLAQIAWPPNLITWLFTCLLCFALQCCIDRNYWLASWLVAWLFGSMVTWLIEWLADRWLLYYCSGSLTSLWCFAWFARWLAHLIHACLAPTFDSSTSRPWFAWLPRSQVYVIRAFKTILKQYFTVGWLVGWLAGWLVTLLVGWVLDMLVSWIALMVCLVRSWE